MVGIHPSKSDILEYMNKICDITFDENLVIKCLIKFSVQIRVIPFGNDDLLWLEPIDIELLNPKGDQVRKWKAKNTASTGGPITLNFPLAKPTICGKWTGSNSYFSYIVYEMLI